MVQTSALEQQLVKQLTQTLGQALSEQELATCLQQIEILSPTAGKRFWHSADAVGNIHYSCRQSQAA
jgi:ATP-binding cassette subfamily B protein